MKIFKILTAAFAIMVGASINSFAAKELKKNEAEVTFKTSINCEQCKAKIEKNIPFEKGVEDLDVNIEDKTVYIKYRADKTDINKLKKAIEKLGYTAEQIFKK
ncbi:MAG: heavy-metal-associated domain-containing protein [Prevotellaceae bacterium]|jgi:copper chaperone CopZ|nr:heavy-metal-associated domain-containing protein [Prevotellaceae bacterium]